MLSGMEQERTYQNRSKESVTNQQSKTMSGDGKSIQSLQDRIEFLEEKVKALEKDQDQDRIKPIRYTRNVHVR